ncbi:MAG: DsbA family protein [Solirubrobacterales bacterium]
MEADKGRREKLLQLSAGAVFLAIIVVAVLIVVSASDSGSGGDTKLEEKAEVGRLLSGIPQEGLLLGDPKAPVELIEFADLQCPFCKAYSEEVLPPIIESRVKRGEVKIDFRNFTIISAQSTPAGAAAIAAGRQGRGWNFVELFYRNQGEEGSGYVTGEFLEAVAKGAGVKNIARWNEERENFTGEVEKTTSEAQSLGFTGTPSFAIRGPGSKGVEPLGTPESTGGIEEAIDAAA